MTDSSGQARYQIRHKQLRVRIILGVLLLICTLLTILAWDSYTNRQAVIHAAEIQTQGYARALKEHAERTFSEVDLLIQETVRAIDRAGGPDRLGQADLRQLLRSKATVARQISSLSLVDTTGRLAVSSVDTAASETNLADCAYYRYHKEHRDDRLFITPPFKSRIDGTWRFALSRRINTPSGEFAGVIVSGTNVSYFENLYATLTSDRNARYSLATISGDYLALAPEPADVYETGKQTNAAFRARVAASPTQTYHPKRSNVFGEPRITSYHVLDRYPVVAIMSFNKNHVLAKWRASTMRTALTSGVFILLVLGLTVQLLKQLQQIEKDKQELLEAKEQAEAATRTKSSFLANMSHEIRAPMNAIVGLAQLTLETELSDRQQGYLTRLKTASQSLLKIINDILDFSKIEAQRIELLQEPFSLGTLLQQVTDLFQLAIEEKGLTFAIEIDPAVPQRLIGDQLRLGQVLNNLVGNAVKFTNRGGIVLQIRQVNHSGDYATLCFMVTDTGIGISAEDAQHLFQPFTQADSSIAHRYGGTGLGLTISQELIHLMGGAITLSSTKDKGSSFSFTIKLGVQQETDQSQVVAQRPAPLYEIAQPIHGATILLVEDSEVNRCVVQELLEKAGLVVTAVCHGGDALEQLKKQQFDAVLMDMQMPEMDGIQATGLIRRLPNGMAIPIIALTGAVTEGDRTFCLEAGMNDHIAKPINVVELLQKLIFWITSGKKEL